MENILKNKFFIILLIVICVLTIFTIALNLLGYGSLVSDIVNLILSPFQRFAAILRESFLGFTGYFREFNRMKTELAELQGDLETYRSEALEARRVIDENEMLRAFYGLKSKRLDFDMEFAKITAWHPGNYISGFTLNRGGIHNIEKDMPVAAVSGADYILTGYISEVGILYSKVTSFIKAGASIGAYIERTGEAGYIEGVFELEQNGLCRFRAFSQHTIPEVGDRIYSSGEGGIYPEDLYIGEIIEIIPDANTHTITGIVKPAMDFGGGTITNAAIIRSFERKFE